MPNTMKHIALVTSIRINSGSGYRCTGIAKYLSLAGYDVTVSGVGRPGADEVGKARYRSIPDVGNIVLLVILAFVINLYLLVRYRPGIIIVSKPLPSSFLPARLYALLSRSKIILDIDDVEHDYWRERFLYRIVLERFEKYAAKRASFITTHSEELLEYLRTDIGIGEGKIGFLPQGIDTALFANADQRADLEKDAGLEGKSIVIYAAHFNVAVKDFSFILQMMARLVRKRRDLVLLVIGDGPTRAAYQQQADDLGLGDAVRFVGSVPHNDIGRYFAAAHVAINYLAPTPANICRASVKLREYLLCGLWVVCNDVGTDPRQFVRWLYSFPTGDLEGFCARVEEAVLRARQGRNVDAAHYIAAHYSWENIVRSFERQLEMPGGKK
jgi:glycosyltransferase involved in cell wall biosynthesis